MMTRVLVVACVLAGGCSRKAPTAESCGPLTVTIDGAPLAAMPHGLARKNVAAGEINYEVEVYNHATTTCEQFLSKSGRSVPDGEVSVRAFAGGGGLMGKGVGLAAHTQAGGDVDLVGPKPAKAGDPVQICVSEQSFTPKMGDHKGKKVTFKGLLTGTYCGELTF